MTFKEKVNEMKIHHEEHKEERHERHEEKIVFINHEK